jgi:hypothetical protein
LHNTFAIDKIEEILIVLEDCKKNFSSDNVDMYRLLLPKKLGNYLFGKKIVEDQVVKNKSGSKHRRSNAFTEKPKLKRNFRTGNFTREMYEKFRRMEEERKKVHLQSASMSA